jgi:hypothetical protein
LTGPTRGERNAFITHILGRRGTNTACRYASEEAIKEAKAHRDEITSTKRPLDDEPNVVSAPKRAKTMRQVPLKAYNALEMPFSASEKASVRVQALKAAISANLPFRVFEDIEVLKLFAMLRREAPAIMPSRKVLAGSLLNEVSAVVETNLAKILHGRDLGLSYVWVNSFLSFSLTFLYRRTDGWKSSSKDAVHALCANVEFKVCIQVLDVVRYVT